MATLTPNLLRRLSLERPSTFDPGHRKSPLSVKCKSKFRIVIEEIYIIICELPLKNRGSLPLREVPKYIALGCSGLATDFLIEVLGLAQFPRTKSPKDNKIIEVKFFIALF